MVNLFKVLINSSKSAFDTDNRKVASYFVVLHNIRASFMVNQFFLCDRFFKTLERPDGIDLGSLPKGWQVQMAYYHGRYYMYNNIFDKAR